MCIRDRYDPMCRNIEKLVNKYKSIPIRDLTLKIFAQKRHALLFEQGRNEVYLDILHWLNERTYL